MLGRFRNSFAEINLKALENNFNHIKNLVHGSSLIPMVKANAYGHGEIQVCRLLEGLGARYFGVALIEEGIRLREAGIQTPILVFGFFDSIGAEALVKYRLTPVLSSFDQIAKIKLALTEADAFPVHVELNTGMQRNGFELGEIPDLINELYLQKFIKLEGLCSHFISSDDYNQNSGLSKKQDQEFKEAINVFRSRLQWPLVCHLSNSGGILSGLTSGYEAFRPGLSLYGAGTHGDKSLKPVLALKSQVAHLRTVPQGQTVSYGGTWRASKDSKIAVIPLGYADGFPRALSNKGNVLINGVRCPVRGRVCMDYFMVDVSHLDQSRAAGVGDEVVLLGQQGPEAIFVEEWAGILDTISYEILTGIQERVPRVYIH